MLFVKPSVWVGLATQTSLLSTTITMLAAPLGALLGVGISQGAGKLVNVAMPFAVTWLLANLQPSVIYFAIVGIAVVAAIVVVAVGPRRARSAWARRRPCATIGGWRAWGASEKTGK